AQVDGPLLPVSAQYAAALSRSQSIQPADAAERAGSGAGLVATSAPAPSKRRIVSLSIELGAASRGKRIVRLTSSRKLPAQVCWRSTSRAAGWSASSADVRPSE